MPRKKTMQEARETINKGIYNVVIFPFIFGFFGLFVPHWSSIYGIILGCMMIILISWALSGYFRKRHQDPSWRALFSVINWDITAFLALVPFWRVFGEPLWLLVLLIVLYILCILLTHRYRYTIAEGVHFHPGSKFGRLFYTLSFIVVVLSGGGSYGFSRSLQVFFGQNTALVVLSACMLPFGFIFIVAFHCGWSKVENPDWDPDKKE